MTNSLNNSLFGTTTVEYNDFSGQVDPGSRLVEFSIRLKF